MTGLVCENSPEVERREFSNGLQVSDASIRLGSQTWSIGQIKEVRITQAGSGFGIGMWGILLFIFGALSTQAEGLLAIFCLTSCIASLAGIWASWNALLSRKVWIKTGLIFKPLLQSRDHQEVEEVGAAIEAALGRHRSS